MFPQALQQLIEMFAKLPGVGPRQATRMAFFVLREPNGYAKQLKDAVETVRTKVGWCAQCFRSMDKNGAEAMCDICKNQNRRPEIVCVVEKEVDLTNIEKIKLFQGNYHVLGGTLSLLDAGAPDRLHIRELYLRMEKLAGVDGAEVIIATSSTSEGDSTALYLERTLLALVSTHPNFKISRLGRGLSMGAEVEYADQTTLENAIKNRTSLSDENTK